MSELLSLPAGHPLEGFVTPNLSPSQMVGTLPPVEVQWATDRDAARQADVDVVAQHEHDTAVELHEEHLDITTPRLSVIEPNWARLSYEDFVLHVYGNGFVAGTTQIIWNGGAEPTDFVDETHVTTVVRPSTASGPIAIPINVAVDGANIAGECTFEFVP